MAIPNASLQVLDGALGVVPGNANGVHLKIGVASAGEKNVLQSFSDKGAMAAYFGSGPLVEAMALALDSAGGPILAIRVDATVDGDVGSVTPTVEGTGSLTVDGDPLDAFDVVVVILAEGDNLAAAAASFKYSLDGGATYSGAYAVPTAGDFELPDTTGLTITFVDGMSGTSFKVGDQYAFTTTAPTFVLDDLSDSLDVAFADPRDWSWFHVVGPPDDVDAAVAMAAALDTLLEAQALQYRFAFGVIELPDDTDANLLEGLADTTSKRLILCAGFADYVSSLQGSRTLLARSSGWAINARLAAIEPSEDAGWVGRGRLPSVVAISRDERVTEGLDAGKISTLRTHVGEGGFFVTNANVKSAVGSDFRYAQNIRVMDIGSRAARAGMLPFLKAKIPVDKVTGLIDERAARAIERKLLAGLEAAVVSTGFASAASVTLDRTVNLISTGNLRVEFRITPMAYADQVTGTIAFFNPFLAQLAA